MPLFLSVLVLFLCALNADGQTASTTPHQETLDEYQRRIATAGAISVMKDDILALRRDVEAQKIVIETLQKPDDEISAFIKERRERNETQRDIYAIKDDVYGLHIDLEAQKALIEKLQAQVTALQTEIDTLKANPVDAQKGK